METLRLGTVFWLQLVRTLCFVSKLVIPGRLLLVVASCGLRVPLPSLTVIENSRQGSPFPNVRHEQENSIVAKHVSTPSVDKKRDMRSHLTLSNK